MTIKDIEKQVEATKEARAQLERSLRDSKDQEKEYRAKADEAAVDGDVVSFKKYKALADDAEAMAYVCRKQLDSEQASPVTVAQTQEAWASYTAEYSKKLAAKLRRFEALKADMLREYAETVELQRQAFLVRERLAGYVGKLPLAVDGEGSLATMYPMEYIGCKRGTESPLLTIGGAFIKDPDAVYYLASFNLDGPKLYEDARQKTVTDVILNHRAG